ncbi:hypothetical protein BOVMAS03_09680 [Streptococcus uberis]
MADLRTTDKVSEFIADFSLDITHIGQGDFTSEYAAYSCTLTYGKTSIPVTYQAHKSQPKPTITDVVKAVVQDAQAYDNYRSIDEFASVFGYNSVDTPVSKIIDVFNKCKEQYEWLCSNEGRPLYSYDLPQLAEMLDEYGDEITKKVNALLTTKATTEAYNNPPVPEGFVSLKTIMDDFDLGDYGDRITDYSSNEYISDAFTSIADDAVDIYHYSLMSWLSDNYGWLEDASNEGLLEGVENGDIIKMAQIAQFVCYERDLYDHQDNILSYYVTNELHNDGLYMVDEDIAEQLSNIGTNFERLDTALDAAKENIRYALVASFEELYGENLAEEMADKVIEENYTIVNPCVMSLSAAHEVIEKGYDQAFDNQWKDTLNDWKDILRSQHIEKLEQIIEKRDSDPYAMIATINFPVWTNLPTEEVFEEWYVNDYGNLQFEEPPEDMFNHNEDILNDSFERLDAMIEKPENRWSSTLSTHDTDKETMTVSSISKDMSASSKEIKEHNTPDTNRSDHPER